MKKIIFALALTFNSMAFAGQGPFLLGAILGDPTGLSGKYDISPTEAFDGALSWSLGGRSGVQMHGDYLRILPNRIGAGDSDLDVYYGIGARIIGIDKDEHKGKVSFGARAPIGLKLELKDPSVEFFGEAAAVLDLIPSTSVEIDLGIGARYRF
jgi:hypothetical protein